MIIHEYRVAIDDAIGWEMHKSCLQWELEDAAEESYREKREDHGLDDEEEDGLPECDVDIRVDGKDFVVTWSILDGTEGQDRKSYTDTQDRKSYTDTHYAIDDDQEDV